MSIRPSKPCANAAPLSLPSRIAPLESGDYAQLKLVGTPVGGGEPLMADNVLCHIGAEETLEAFTAKSAGRKTRRNTPL